MVLAEKLIVMCLMVLVLGVLGLGIMLARLESRIAYVESGEPARRMVAQAMAARGGLVPNQARAPVVRPAPVAAVEVPVPVPAVTPVAAPTPPPVKPATPAVASSPTSAAAVAQWQASPGKGTTYYVAATGQATGTGTKDAPYREVRQALPRLQSGDTVLIADGQYQGFTINGLNGTAAQLITFQAAGKNVEIMPTADRRDNRDTISLDGCSYLVFDGLRSFKANRAAMRTEGGHHIAVRHCVFGDNAVWGLFTGHTDDLLIEQNECYRSAQQHGIYVSNSPKRPVIRGNYCHDNNACGIQINADLSCGPDGLCTGAVLTDNLLVGNGRKGGAAINLDGVQDSLVANNLLYDNHASGIVVYKHDGAAGPHHVRLVHNTIVMARDARYAIQIGNTIGPNTVRNNILIDLNATRGGIAYNEVADVANVDSDYNLFASEAAVIATDDWHTRTPLADWQKAGHEVHSLAAPFAAVFVDPTAQNYHLSPASPALAHGDPAATLPRDAEGNARDRTAAPALGCFR